ncbi:MAG: aromatic ring-hydroxylating dioxygenase subunit alpha [Acidimicrobiales bacterium]|nr:aromatic ring-hydroxylating dioxygenase subunit alpha [Acidimicrobiales bacterium]
MMSQGSPPEARCPGPSARDILLADPAPPPAVLLAESPVYLGSDDIAYHEYTSPDFLADEYEHLWSRTWQWACRDEHIPEPGDYYVYDIGDRSALIVRGDDGGIRAFANACLHRGTQLKPPGSCGFSRSLRCPFHGWTWALDGRLTEVPAEWDFPHVAAADYALPELACGRWGGFVFVNWSDTAPPLDDYLGVLPEHFANWDLADRYIEAHAQKRLPANWKAAAAAFLEAYHVMETHPQSVRTTGDANTQYDVFDEHVTRFLQTTATPSPHLADADRPTEQQMLDLLLARKAPDDTIPQLRDGQTARDGFARFMQQTMGARYGRDFSHLSTSESIDSIEYFLFPNGFFFRGLQFSMVYRFRPDGHDPDHCWYDVMMLRPRPPDGRPPDPPNPTVLDVDDSYAAVPGFSKSLAAVLDQDTSNLAAQTRGFKASRKPGQTLGNYQEVRTRHLHDTVKRYIAQGKSELAQSS